MAVEKGFKGPDLRIDRYAAAAIGITLFGSILRIYQLGAENITCDEGYSIRLAGLGIDQIIKTLFTSDFNPPLHFLLLRYWTGAFGNSEVSARLPSAILGAASIFAIYKLGQLIFNRRVGLIAALLLSLSWFQVYYSQEARAYSLMVLMSILSLYYFVSLLKERNTKNSALYLVFSAFLLYSHLFGAFIVAAQNIYVLYLFLAKRGKSEGAFRRWALCGWTLHQLALLAAFSPWLFVLSNQVFRAKELANTSSWVIEKPTSMSVLQPLVSFAGSTWLLLLYSAAIIGASVTSGMGKRLLLSEFQAPSTTTDRTPFKDILRMGSDGAKISLLAIWLLAPSFLALVISYTSVPIYIDKYLIGSSPALYLLVARSMDRLADKSLTAAAIAIALIVSLSGYGLWDIYATVNKKQSKDMASVIDENASAGDLVIINPRNYVENVFDYYSRRTDLVEVGFPSRGFYANQKNVAELYPIVKNYDRVWLVKFLDDEKGLALIKGALNRTHELAGDGRYAGVELFYYEKKER